MANSNYLFIGAYIKIPAKYYTKTTTTKRQQCSSSGILHGEQGGAFCSVCGSKVETTEEHKVSTERMWRPIYKKYPDVEDELEDFLCNLNLASESTEYDFYYISPLEYIDMRYNESPKSGIIEFFNDKNTLNNYQAILNEVKKLQQEVLVNKYLNNTKSIADLLKESYEKDFEICFGVIHDPEY